jgi:hypothetical protein
MHIFRLTLVAGLAAFLGLLFAAGSGVARETAIGFGTPARCS